MQYTYNPGRQLTSVAEPGASCRNAAGAVYTVDGGDNPVPRNVKCSVITYDLDSQAELVRYPTNHPTDTDNRGVKLDVDYDESGRVEIIKGTTWPPSSAELLNLAYDYRAGADTPQAKTPC